MGFGLERPQQLAPVLWVLFALFVARVAGQALVATLDVPFLPPMQAWYSGLLAYEILLPAQILIVALMMKICLDFSGGRGFFVEPRRILAIHWLYFGYAYLAVMIARYPVQMVLHPETRWLGGTIPIFFHWVLAAFVIAVGRYHRRHYRP